MPDVLAAYFEMLASPGLSPNGMSQFEGGSADTLEHISMVMCAMQEGLMQSVAPRPGEQEIIRVFPAWPKAWDTSFRLLARGGFEVTSAREAGRVLFVEIASRRGETCFLRNPWGKPCTVDQSGARPRLLSGELLRFATSPGGTLPHLRGRCRATGIHKSDRPTRPRSDFLGVDAEQRSAADGFGGSGRGDLGSAG